MRERLGVTKEEKRHELKTETDLCNSKRVEEKIAEGEKLYIRARDNTESERKSEWCIWPIPLLTLVKGH